MVVKEAVICSIEAEKTEIETGVYVKAEKTKIAQNRNSFKSRRRRQIFVKKALKMFKRGRQKNV